MQGNVTGWIAIRGAHRVLAFLMKAAIERLAENAPLDGHVSAPTKIMGAIDRPTQRAMIQNQPVHIFGV